MDGVKKILNNDIGKQSNPRIFSGHNTLHFYDQDSTCIQRLRLDSDTFACIV